MKIPILFENKNLYVFDKPAHLSVHRDGREDKKDKKTIFSFSDYLLKNFKKLKGVGENVQVFSGLDEIEIQKPGLVHRLDKDTTGCLVVAKNQSSYENLKIQWKEKKVKKEYLAWVWGNVRHDTGIIDKPIARDKSDFRKKNVVELFGNDESEEELEAAVRESLTRYKVLKRLKFAGVALTLMNFYPETGRTHQIRVHTKSIGHPIVGDHLYGPTKHKIEREIFGKNKVRQLLHAKSITFHNPETGEILKISSPIPKDFLFAE